MLDQPGLPKLKVGCSWIARPARSLNFLLSESRIPVKFNVNRRHFILLAKYRPVVPFLKFPSFWDWAVVRAHQQAETRKSRQVPEPFLPHPQQKKWRGSTINSLEVEPIAKLFPETRSKNLGWPNLLTAKRVLARRQPRRQVANQEMYASLSKPPPPDVLGPDWMARHKLLQRQLLQKSSMLPTFPSVIVKENFSVSSRLASARSETVSIVSSGNRNPNQCSIPRTPPKYRSAHVVSYTPLEKSMVHDNLPSDWKAKHRIRQEKILHRLEEREKLTESLDSAHSSQKGDVNTDIIETAIQAFIVQPKESGKKPLPASASFTVPVGEGSTTVPSPTTIQSVLPLEVTISARSVPKLQAAPLINSPSSKSRSPSPLAEAWKPTAAAELGLMKDWLRTQIPASYLEGNPVEKPFVHSMHCVF